jgi:hypothetical protein
MNFFSQEEYDTLHRLVFREGYPGYKPEVRELPNGDGKVDADKRYAHVAMKYLNDEHDDEHLWGFYKRAHDRAFEVALALGCPISYFPDSRYGALRVLEYPAGAVSNEHTDFDLFTLTLFRNQPGVSGQCSRLHGYPELTQIGEIGELAGLGAATPHSVRASETVQQAIVYFAIPDHAAPLGTGTVGSWLTERVARSRTEGYR